MELNKFYKGEAFDAYTYFGAHITKDAVIFRVYAPRAKQVNIIGEFSFWQEQAMSLTKHPGVWEYVSQNAHEDQMYKYIIYSDKGRCEHCDPYGFGMEMRPGNCSIIRNPDEYSFTDGAWMRKRSKNFDKPMNIYELHLGSWKKKGWQWYLYDELADELICYLKYMNYTHVEFMPLAEHPFDGSWGYQGTGYFAPSSRYGTASQLKYLIDRLHNANIGVILDFVPVHFAVDSYGLGCFDGKPLYEHSDTKAAKSEWGSYNFDHGKSHVKSFLQSAANFWLKEFHFDALRFDAVSRLIYIGGDYFKGENAAGIAFLKDINRGLKKLHPKAILIAEDSSAYSRVTRKVEEGGLGFDYKWDLAWTYNVIKLLGCTGKKRAQNSHMLFSALEYSYSEKFILPLSHDETTRGTKALINRFYGTDKDKLSQLKLLYLFMICHPGKKLSFMGNELGQKAEWDVTKALDWEALYIEGHRGIQKFTSDLNYLYLKKKALWKSDAYELLDCRCNTPGVMGFSRPCGDDTILAFFNFTEKTIIFKPDVYGNFSMLINSDWDVYSGSTKKQAKRSIVNKLPAYSGVMYIKRK